MSEKYDSGSERDIIIKLKSGFSGYVLPSPVLLYTLPRKKGGWGRGVLASKETVVLRRWGNETQNFGFIN